MSHESKLENELKKKTTKLIFITTLMTLLQVLLSQVCYYMNIFSNTELKVHRFYTQISFANYGRYEVKITLLKIRKNALKYI